MQVQASGFAENLHPPSSDSIFCKKPAYPNTPFSATKTTTTDPMERRMILNDNTMRKKKGDSNLEKVSNEKQNSLSSGIRINFGENFPIILQNYKNY